MLNIKKKLSKLKFSKSYPENAPIVIYEDDYGSIKILREYILKRVSKKNTVLRPSNIYTNIAGINLLIYSILKVIFSFDKTNLINIRTEYQLQILKSIDAEVIITRVDDSISLSYLVNKYKKGRFISIQNGFRSNYTLKNLSKRGIQFDILFSFGEDLPKRWTNLGCKINESYSIGSVLAGVYAENRSQIKLYDIGYVSQWKPLAKEEHFEKLKNICIEINKVQNFTKTKIKIAVFGRDNNFEEEKKFYDQYLSNYEYIPNKRYSGNFLSIYQLADQTNLLVTYYSTVGIEFISFDTKVLFVDFDNSHFLDNISDGIWIYRNNNEIGFQKYILKILEMKFKDWKSTVSDWIHENSS